MDARAMVTVLLCCACSTTYQYEIKLRLGQENLQPIKFEETDFNPKNLLARSKLGVDGDPEFIVAVRGIERPLCFNVRGQQGEVLRLLQHESIGLYVNGKIIERNETRKTYIGSISILRRNIRIIARRQSVLVNRYQFGWHNMSAFLLHGNRIVIGQNLLAVTFRNMNITLVLRRHMIRPDDELDTEFEDSAPYMMTSESDREARPLVTPGDDFIYLGFYIADSRGLNRHCHGLLGQFVHKRATIDKLRYKNGKLKARLRVLSPGFSIPRYSLASISDRVNLGTGGSTSCWLLRRDGEGVVDGNYIDYVIRDIRNDEAIRFQ